MCVSLCARFSSILALVVAVANALPHLSPVTVVERSILRRSSQPSFADLTYQRHHGSVQNGQKVCKGSCSRNFDNRNEDHFSKSSNILSSMARGFKNDSILQSSEQQIDHLGLYYEQKIKIRIRFHCHYSGQLFEDFEWSVRYYSRTAKVYYLPLENIDRFTEMRVDDRFHPLPFWGAWSYWSPGRDCGNYCCTHFFDGWFEGTAQTNLVQVVFIDRDTVGNRSPSIKEHCSGHAQGRPDSWSVTGVCRFLHAQIVIDP